MVHFPIALLAVGALIEAWRLARGKRVISSTTVTCLVLGALAAVVAAGMGWVLAGDDTGNTLWWHRWMGIATAAVSLVVAMMVLVTRGKQESRQFIVGLGTIACAVMVGITGHFGGEMTHGENYLTEFLLPQAEQNEAAVAKSSEKESGDEASSTETVAASDGDAGATAVTSLIAATQPVTPVAAAQKVDFEKQIKPILQATCYDCHGADEARGNLRLDSPEAILRGGKAGPSVIAHDSEKSQLIRRVLGLDGKKRMPKGDDPLPAGQIALLKAWVDQGAPMGKIDLAKVHAVATSQQYKAPLAPRKVEVPPASGDLTNPVDRILAGYLKAHKVQAAKLVEDRVYARRVYLDVVGMPPTPAELAAFEADSSPDKRAELVDKLLGDKRRYAENWMTFWNDALRNDYKGPGYIDGGRKQITGWLYDALYDDMPYDEFVRELVNPKPESEGFAKGIVWRGAVSASQVPELQASQNISQVFLGINMKCASCHDSFINEWKLTDAYGLASVYSDKPMKVYRCEKETGKTAELKFLWPQLGSIDASAPKPERLAQLAHVLTCKENGRFARTIVNRFWARFMGRGIVEPVDEMDNEPWDADLLDFLANDLVEHGYDLKHTIKTILTSRAYQMPTVGMGDPNAKEFTFEGPVVRRLSAEQFCDAVSDLTSVWTRVPAARPKDDDSPLGGKWIWSDPSALSAADPGTIYARKEFDLAALPADSIVAATCDNGYTLYVNGKKIAAGKEWGTPAVRSLKKVLVKGKNVIAVEAVNDPGATPRNPAALWVLVSMRSPAGSDGEMKVSEVGTDQTWIVSKEKVPGWEKVGFKPGAEWKPAAELADATAKYDLVANLSKLNKAFSYRGGRYRAVWSNNDRLMTALGRPNREQTVTYRQSAATTLQALELTNGPELYDQLQRGARVWVEAAGTPREKVKRIYLAALGREPTAEEMSLAMEMVGAPVKEEGMEDFLWAMVMLPEFQLVY